MNVNLGNAATCISIAVGLLGIGYAVGINKKLNNVSEIVGKSVDSMLTDGKIDISQELIDETIQSQVRIMVNNTVHFKVNNACESAVRDVQTVMYNRISDAAEKAVNSTYQSMEAEAKETIKKEPRNIDISELKRQIKTEAKEMIKDKMSSSMDDILEQYNANLMNVQNIYSSIAKSMGART